MIEADSVAVYCWSCGRLLDESQDSPDARRPCPDCGDTRRRLDICVSETLTVRDRIDLKAREAGKSKGNWYAHYRVGADLHRISGVWMELVRIVDRRSNRYYERITNPETGEVVREVDEPLDKHIWHGGDKQHSE